MASILATRAERRLQWSDDKQLEYNQQLGRLARAHNATMEYIITLVEQEGAKMRQQGKNSWQVEYHLPKIEGVDPRTALNGFWKSKLGKYDFYSRWEAGLTETFWAQARRLSRQRGFWLDEVTNTDKSRFRTFIRIREPPVRVESAQLVPPAHPPALVEA